MLENAYLWFIGLPLYFRVAAYLLALPFALMALGVVIIFFDMTAAKVVEEKGALKGLLMLGSIGGGVLAIIFGTTVFLSSVAGLPEFISFFIGLICGLGAPVVVCEIMGRRV